MKIRKIMLSVKNRAIQLVMVAHMAPNHKRNPAPLMAMDAVTKSSAQDCPRSAHLRKGGREKAQRTAFRVCLGATTTPTQISVVNDTMNP
jgi:hypothetical protein